MLNLKLTKGFKLFPVQQRVQRFCASLQQLQTIKEVTYHKSVSESSKKKGYILKDNPKEADKFSNFFADAFVNEPVLKAMQATRQSVYDFGEIVFKSEAQNDHSLTIVAECNDEIVGICLNEDGSVKNHVDCLPESVKPYKILAAIMEAIVCQSTFLKDRGYDDNQSGLVLHLFVIAVAPHMGGQGIGRQLAAETLKVAKEEGYKFVRVECSGAYSAKLCKKLGFVSELQFDYESFQHEDRDKIQVDKLGPHTCMDLMWYEVQ